MAESERWEPSAEAREAAADHWAYGFVNDRALNRFYEAIRLAWEVDHPPPHEHDWRVTEIQCAGCPRGTRFDLASGAMPPKWDGRVE